MAMCINLIVCVHGSVEPVAVFWEGGMGQIAGFKRTHERAVREDRRRRRCVCGGGGAALGEGDTRSPTLTLADTYIYGVR